MTLEMELDELCPLGSSGRALEGFLPSFLRIIEAELSCVEVVRIETGAQPFEEFGVSLVFRIPSGFEQFHIPVHSAAVFRWAFRAPETHRWCCILVY
jgi:hypothetical protein